VSRPKRLRPDEFAAPSDILPEGDRRVAALREANAAPKQPEEYVAQIALLWDRAQRTFLDIGRLLIRAKEQLPHGEYIAAVEVRLPFGPRTAHMLREAARWVFALEESSAEFSTRLPASYSTVYLLSTFSPHELSAADAAGLVRPDLRRAELLAWRYARRETIPSREHLQALRERLRRERERLDTELARVEAQLANKVIEGEFVTGELEANNKP
jgi:hypothetical protein